MVGNHNSSDNRLKAIEYYLNNDISQEKISEIFKISRRTFIRWLKEYEDKKIERKTKKNVSYKIKEKHVNYAKKILAKNNGLSINILWSKIKTKYDDFDISQGHLARVIRDNNITRKRTTRRHYPETRYGKAIDLKKELKYFYSIVDKYSLNKIISIDETSVYAQMPSNYSRCNLGQRCVLKTKNNKVFTKYTLVCAMSSKRIIGYELYENGGMNALRMIEFINKYIKNKFKNNLIIMDNGGSHKNKEIKKVIENTGNRILYCVPYKPKTNAVESFFSQFKHYFVIENKSITYQELKKHVKKTLKKIPKSSFTNYMKYAYQSKEPRKYIEKESTRRKKSKIYKK